ncbi:hypothetical protein LTR97_004391 [Elasticomyces elasticus]|uniref:Queuosine 5'-phosphate N-glycosylase/hydrolase n=1 Tax=Elasticomyces elasticus TaxID=574655 RepID=A0AAN7ZNZ0_9PEZI|nr:hypothetical protein LTR97_004391 [Elasticomyces elasticus]
MSDDEADPELLELLRQSLFTASVPQNGVSSNTGVLKDAEYIYNNSIDVALQMHGTKAAAASIYNAMQERSYSTQAWSEHELHPKLSDDFSEVDMVNFIFTMDLLNFSFWSALDETERFQVEYQGRRWTGYNSLVACLRRGLDEGIPITTPRYWRSPECTDEALHKVFRSTTEESMPMLQERLAVLREAAAILHESFADDDDLEGEITTKELPIRTKAPEALDPITDTTIEHDKTHAVAMDEFTVPESSGAATFPNKSADADTFAPVDTVDESPIDTTTTKAQNPDRANEADQHQSPPAPDLSITISEDNGEISTQHEAFTSSPPRPDMSVVRLIEEANRSAGKLVNLLAKHFPCFRDETRFDGRKVRLLKRAQIFVADLWAAFNGTGHGEFNDIDNLTMFADYRLPQMLHSLGVLSYSPTLLYRLRDRKEFPSGHSWEVQLRGCSIWAVELIRRDIVREHPEAEGKVNAVLIDFFLYDLAKEREKGMGGELEIPHHRTRSIWY